MQNIAPVDQANPVKPNTSIPQNEYEEAIIKLAQDLNACAPRRTSFYIPARLKQFMEFFQECYDYFNEATRAQVSVSQTSEWLLDNFYVIEQAVRQIEEDLPEDYYQRLLKTGEGWPRIYLLALVIARLQGEDARLDIEQVKHSLQLFQDTTPLSTGELWALPLILRLAVLESRQRHWQPHWANLGLKVPAQICG
jgi:cyclic beta-1,2-glucan synthetase